MKAIDYIRKGWVQGHYAVNSDGRAALIGSPAACAWCTTGAILASYPDGTPEHWNARRKLADVIDTWNFSVWNDAAKRTHAEVIAAFEQAGI